MNRKRMLEVLDALSNTDNPIGYYYRVRGGSSAQLRNAGDTGKWVPNGKT